MEFLTQFNCLERNKAILSCVGQEFEFGYKYRTNKDGSRELVVDKENKKDLRAYIASFADDVNLTKMYERYLNGDISALDKNKGFYADTNEIPHSMNEFMDLFDDQERTFGGLPTKFKERFNNDYKQYAMAISQGTIKEHIRDFFYNYYNDYKFTRNIAKQFAPDGKKDEKKEEKKESEVKENEKG